MKLPPNFFVEVRAQHERLRDLLERLLGGHPGVVRIASRVKSLESIKEKLSRIRKANALDLNDLIGFRVVVKSPSGIGAIRDILGLEFLIESYFTEHVHLWDRACIVLRLNESRTALPEWKGYGAHRAEVQVVTASGERWQELFHILHYKPDRPDKAIAIVATQSVQEKVVAFEQLLETPDVHEKRDIHPFLEDNEFLLHPNPSEIFSEVPIGLGTRHRIDFLIREADGSYILVEIENPRHKIFTKSGDFTAAVNHAQRQVEDWQEWIAENISTVQKVYPDMSSPKGLVVLGRLGGLTQEEKKRLARRNTNLRGGLTLWTYDHLIENAKAWVSSVERSVLENDSRN